MHENTWSFKMHTCISMTYMYVDVLIFTLSLQHCYRNLFTMLYGNFLTQQSIRDINNFEMNSHFNFSVHLKLWGFSHFGIRHLKFKGLKNLHVILYGLHCSLILSGTIYIQVYVYGMEMYKREFLALYMSDMETKNNHIIYLFF